jgi:hypothetical protein
MTESRCGSSSYLPSRDPKGLHAKAGYLLPVDHTRFYVEGLGAMPLESSSMVSALAFSASTRFAVEVGATTARISLKDLQESTAGMLNELFKSADEYISARHRYLNVEDLHTTGVFVQLSRPYPKAPGFSTRSTVLESSIATFLRLKHSTNYCRF